MGEKVQIKCDNAYETSFKLTTYVCKAGKLNGK